MNATTLAIRLITDGFVIIEEAVVGAELESFRDGFERLATRTGVRTFTPEQLLTEPALVNLIGHPGVLPVVDAFMGYFGHEPAIAWLNLCRDTFDPAAPPPPPYDVHNGSHETLSLHNDGSGPKELAFDVLGLGCAAFLFMDDAYADAGCMVQVRGSHYLTRRHEEGNMISPTREFVMEHCPIVFPRIPAGSVLIQRAFNFHAPGPPPRQHRRTLRTDYTPKAMFDKMRLDGQPSRPTIHQTFPPEVLEMLPADRHRCFVW